MKIKLANPRGFCAGVDRAIEIVNRALDKYGAPVYVRHEVVHNRTVVGELKAKGAIFVEELDEVPPDSLVIFSAHGVSKAVRAEAERRDLQVFDATCPLVTKVHNEVQRYSRTQQDTVLIGHAGHPEVEGTMGQFDDPQRIHLVETEADVSALEVANQDQMAFVTQTTLSVDDTARVIDALKQKFPSIKGPRNDDICYATQNRQDAVKDLARSCDLILVVGSANSSNSNRLREVGERFGVPSYLIDNETEIDPEWLKGVETVGLTSGASAPESLVERVIARLNCIEEATTENVLTREEHMEFSLPKALR